MSSFQNSISIIIKTDVIDQCQKYVDKAKDILKDKNVRNFYCAGLQDFNF